MNGTSSIPKGLEFRALSNSIREQFNLILGDSEQVTEDCRRAGCLLAAPPDPSDRKFLRALARSLQEVDDDIGRPVCDLLLSALVDHPAPWPLLRLVLKATHPAFAAAGVEAALSLIDEDRLPLRTPLLKEFARLLELESGPFEDEDLVARLAETLDRRLRPAGAKSPGGLVHLLGRGAGPGIRRMAARLLDAGGEAAPAAEAKRILGPKAYEIFRPYLEFTLATYGDLLLLSAGKRISRPLMEMFRVAERDFGVTRVREIVAALGWERVRLGLRIAPYVELTAPGSLPMMLRPGEAALFDGGTARVAGKCFLVTAHGGTGALGGGGRKSRDPVDRFRMMNILHAELLGEILDIVPLDRERVEKIVAAMEGIVENFHFLFHDVFGECAILPEVWRGIRDRVTGELQAQTDADRPSPDLTRLVLAFEDPANLGEVRSLHGLKRFLHQKGLKLGFELVGTDHSPNRTVDLLLIRGDGTMVRAQTLRYVEFESGRELDAEAWLPFPVRMAVDGLAWQLLHGTEKFPGVDAYLFGNEVHYYISFRNHPVFLRIDYSPPQRGGMIDLEYFGVSNYELDLHPDIGLGGISEFFRSLDFDVQTEDTRLFVRYDKERSSNLGDLLNKAAALFRLVPFLMDVDWIIGSLQLPPEARRIVVDYWADRFKRSGVLPIGRILNAGRTAILTDRGTGPTGTRETVWNGAAPYADRCSAPAPDGLLPGLRAALEKLGLRVPPWSAEAAGGPVPLLELERNFLEPLRAALACGRLEPADGRPRPTPDGIFQLENEADRFVDLLSDGGNPIREAIALARPLAELDRFVEFETTGFVGDLKVEKAKVVVRGGEIAVYAVRDRHGVVRLGFYATEGFLYRRRTRPGAPWRSNLRHDCGSFWSLLIGANYLRAATAGVPIDAERTLAELQAAAALHRPSRGRRPGGRERILAGMRVAPGRAVGPAIFDTAGCRPADLDGAILVAREVRPADNPFLFRASGIISTGGAVLSHAALLAIQFGKPAILAEGRWTTAGHRRALLFSSPVYREAEHRRGAYSVCALELVEERSEKLVEQDLVVLDADEGCAEILGQGRDTATLWDNLRLLGDATGRFGLTTADAEVVEIRAQQVRARHQIEKVLGRITEPTIASFAVQELVVGRTLAGIKSSDRIRLLSILIGNQAVAETVPQKLAAISERLIDGCQAARREALERIPASRFLYEIVGLRLRYLRLCGTLDGVRETLSGCGLPGIPAGVDETDPLREAAALRLSGLADELLAELARSGPRTRHVARRLRRIDRVLGLPASARETVRQTTRALDEADARAVAEAGSAWVLPAAACGLETHPHIGWKAANLAEVDRLAGAAVVPEWFVVTDRAFRGVLAQPVEPAILPAECRVPAIATLGQAIEAVLQADGLEIARKAACIRALWIAAELPDELKLRVKAACDEMREPDGDEVFLALRSSSCDEDSETEMRAGEFETYLFVRGVDSVLEHLKLTWSGFWTERAIYSRRNAVDAPSRPAGGLIVQRMIRSRVSGVLQTVNVGRGDLQEMLINVGLGQGEGIVSGRVSADLVTVVKDIRPGEDPVHFNYLTNDKTEQVVFDEKRGSGTRIGETLYHQRLRPAVEYTELCEIARLAIELEEAYGYPLDIEFAIEGSRLWLLQARPIATFSVELRETLEFHPLKDDPSAAGDQGVAK